MYANPQVKLSMSAIREVVANNSGEATARCVLPPAIVMKRGEPLEEWAQRLRPNLPTALNALCAVAELLKDLHACGYIYYAMKPSNVAWFGDEKKWKLIDFACAARKGANPTPPCVCCACCVLLFAAGRMLRCVQRARAPKCLFVGHRQQLGGGVPHDFAPAAVNAFTPAAV